MDKFREFPPAVVKVARDEITKTNSRGEFRYDYVGSLAIMCVETDQGGDYYRKVKRNQCCGIYDGKVEHKGKTYLFTFDYGH